MSQKNYLKKEARHDMPLYNLEVLKYCRKQAGLNLDVEGAVSCMSRIESGERVLSGGEITELSRLYEVPLFVFHRNKVPKDYNFSLRKMRKKLLNRAYRKRWFVCESWCPDCQVVLPPDDLFVLFKKGAIRFILLLGNKHEPVQNEPTELQQQWIDELESSKEPIQIFRPAEWSELRKIIV